MQKETQRMTKAKSEVLTFIEKYERPFSAQELLNHLDKQGISVNKTTVYRQLDGLLENEIIQEVNLNDGVVRYELKHDDCHHHIVCTNCGKVTHVELGEQIDKLQEKLSQESGYKVEQHMLEFFGKCPACLQQE